MGQTVARIGDRPTDAALVAACVSGSQDAKEALFRRHVGLATGLAFRLLGRDGDVEDVVQESFLCVFRALDQLEDRQAFVAWFSAIVTRTTIAFLRRRRFRRALGLERCPPIDIDKHLAPTTPPDVQLELRQVYQLVDDLPADERVILILSRVEELSLGEVAARVGSSLSTVKRRLSSAEERLRKRTGMHGGST